MKPKSDDRSQVLSHRPAELPPDVLAEREWMRCLALSLADDAHAAADLEQDTWVKLLRFPPGSGVSLRAWIATVMRNTARNRHRGRRRRVLREQFWSVGQPTEEQPATGPDSDVLGDLRGAVSRLDEPYRQTIALRFYGQLTPKQIGERLGLPAATVRTRLRRGLQRLRDDLDQRHGGDRGRWKAGLLAWAAPDRAAGGRATADTVVLPLNAASVVCGVSILLGGLWLALDRGASEAVRPTTVHLDHERPTVDDGLLAAVVPTEPAASLVVTPPALPDTPAPRVTTLAPEPFFELLILDGESDEPLTTAQVRLIPADILSSSNTRGLEDLTFLPPFSGSPVLLPMTNLEELRSDPEGGVTWAEVRAPGYAPSMVGLCFERTSSNYLRLWRPCSLSLEVHGTPGETYWLQAQPSTGRQVTGRFVTAGPDGRAQATWDELRPGKVVVKARCCHLHPVTFASQVCSIQSSGSAQVVLIVQDPHERPPEGALAGSLLVPEALTEDFAVQALAKRFAAEHWRRQEGEPQAPAYTLGPPRGDGLRELHWSFDALPEGHYDVMLLPLGHESRVEVLAGEVTRLDLSSTDWSEVEVSVVSGLDGRQLDAPRVRWQFAWTNDRSWLSSLGAGPGSDVWPDEDGRLWFGSGQERGKLLACFADPSGDGTVWQAAKFLTPGAGQQHVELRAWPVVHLPIQLMSAEGRPIYPHMARSRLVVRCLETADGQDPAHVFIEDRSNTHQDVRLSVPGRYEVSVRPGVSRLPVQPIQFELLAGRQPLPVSLTVDVSRR